MFVGIMVSVVVSQVLPRFAWRYLSAQAKRRVWDCIERYPRLFQVMRDFERAASVTKVLREENQYPFFNFSWFITWIAIVVFPLLFVIQLVLKLNAI